jgi:hypothetical protein
LDHGRRRSAPLVAIAVHGPQLAGRTQRGPFSICAPAARLAFIEAFDQIPLTQILQTMRSLDLFREESLGSYLGIALQNKLAHIFAPAIT